MSPETLTDAGAILDGMFRPWRLFIDMGVLSRSNSPIPCIVGWLCWAIWLSAVYLISQELIDRLKSRSATHRQVKDLMEVVSSIDDLDDPERLAACAKLDTLIDSRFVALISHSPITVQERDQWWVTCPVCEFTSRGFYDVGLAFDESHTSECTFDGKLRQPGSTGYGTATSDAQPYPVTSICPSCGEATDAAEGWHPDCLDQTGANAREALANWALAASNDELTRCLLAALHDESDESDMLVLYRHLADPSPEHLRALKDLADDESDDNDVSDLAVILLAAESIRHTLLVSELFWKAEYDDPMTVIRLAERFAALPSSSTDEDLPA